MDAVSATLQAGRLPVIVQSAAPPAAPEGFTLGSVYPNPANPGTNIAYEVPQQGHLTLSIFNLLGQEIIRLVDGVKTPGRYSVWWDGVNSSGLSVASGVYLYQLTNDSGYAQTKRLTLLK